MATVNPFDLLNSEDAEDPSQLIAAQLKTATPKAASQTKPTPQAKPAKLPSKPLPPAQAVREVKSEAFRGGRGGERGFGRGRGNSGYRRDLVNEESSFNTSGMPAGPGAPDGDMGRTGEKRIVGGGPRGPYRGRGANFTNGEVADGERPRRVHDRRSGTGRGNDFKREGGGRGNWGKDTDEFALQTEEAMNEGEKILGNEKPKGDDEPADGNKDNSANEAEDKEPEEKEMTLEEYEKVLEEKRKALQAQKVEGRKVDTKEFASMQQIANKKENNDVFIKLGSEKDKRREALEKEEKAKKSVSINEFLKPADGERHFNSGGRGRGRGGRGSRGGYGGREGMISNAPAPSIEDPGQFPTLGAK